MTFSLPYLGLLRQNAMSGAQATTFLCQQLTRLWTEWPSPHAGIAANHYHCPIVKTRCREPSDLLTSWERERGFINKGDQMPSGLLGTRGCGTVGSEMTLQAWPGVSNCSCKARPHFPLSPEAVCTEAGDSAYF